MWSVILKIEVFLHRNLYCTPEGVQCPLVAFYFIVQIPITSHFCWKEWRWCKVRLKNQRSNCHHPLDHTEIKRFPEKHILLLYWLHQSLWLRGSQQTGKFFKRWEYQTTWSASWEICTQVRKQQLELDMEQQTGFKSGKEYVKAVYCHPAYLTYMQNTSCKMLGWMKHKMNQDCREKYQ